MTCFSEEKVCENKTIHLISRSFPLPNFLLENMHMDLDVSWREDFGVSHSLWLWVAALLRSLSAFSPGMVAFQSWQEGSQLLQVAGRDPKKDRPWCRHLQSPGSINSFPLQPNHLLLSPSSCLLYIPDCDTLNCTKACGRWCWKVLWKSG